MGLPWVRGSDRKKRGPLNSEFHCIKNCKLGGSHYVIHQMVLPCAQSSAFCYHFTHTFFSSFAVAVHYPKTSPFAYHFFFSLTSHPIHLMSKQTSSNIYAMSLFHGFQVAGIHTQVGYYPEEMEERKQTSPSRATAQPSPIRLVYTPVRSRPIHSIDIYIIHLFTHYRCCYLL